jgi:hypothetical protein
MSSYERAVLALLLERYPALSSIDEVVRYVAPEPAGFPERDAVDVAIRELVQAGLVHRLGGFVFVTEAAVHFERLRSR